MIKQLGRWWIVALSALALRAEAPRLYHDSFRQGADQWIVEQMPGGTVKIENGVLDIDDVAGCTVWFKPKLTVPVVIRYQATVVSAGGPNDRVSDLNCFWMASAPTASGDLFAPGHGRTGEFSTYDTLRLYYVGYGGNENTTTRFRRYAGGGPKPLLPENDRHEPALLLKANHRYQITLVARADGTVRFYRDGERIFDFKDDQLLREGWFGIRTVKSHLRIEQFEVLRDADGL
jgi:hypothetical protein